MMNLPSPLLMGGLPMPPRGDLAFRPRGPLLPAMRPGMGLGLAFDSGGMQEVLRTAGPRSAQRKAVRLQHSRSRYPFFPHTCYTAPTSLRSMRASDCMVRACVAGAAGEWRISLSA
jgi:hypothetical protein